LFGKLLHDEKNIGGIMPTFTTTDGVSINYQLDGDAKKPALILSNSLGTNLEMWAAQMPTFIEHFHVIRYDKRGHGKSGVKVGPSNFERLSLDAIELLDHLHVKKASWCGLSMGGMSGMWLAVNRPERFTKFAITCTSAHVGSPDIYNGRIKFVRENGMTKLRPLVIDRWFTKNFQEANPNEVSRIGDMIETTSAEGYMACCAAIRDMDQREAIRGITSPVLVIAGAHDNATPTAQGRLIAENIAGSIYVELNGAHLSNIEAAEGYTSAVVKFLKG
jgi:3-oxoadipate enol-lactonase